MKKIQLTQNKYTLVDDEDYDKLNSYNWFIKNGRYTNYAAKSNKNKCLFMHRLIMNCPKDRFIDHINKNGLDNRKENLRICNNVQNSGNRKMSGNNTSGIKGVGWHKRDKNWFAKISINNKSKYLGYFNNKEDAKLAYEKAAKAHFGEFYSDGIRK